MSRRGIAWLSAAVATALIAAGAAVVANHGGSNRPEAEPARQLNEVPVPPGWQAVAAMNVQVAVPDGWAVRSSSGDRCPQAPPGQLVVGAPTPGACPGAAPSATVTVVQGVELPPSASVVTSTLNGLSVESPSPQPGGGLVYAFPALDATITLGDGTPPGVLSSVGPSPQFLVLASGPASVPPSNWTTVSYRGVQFDVPRSWPHQAAGRPVNCLDLIPGAVETGPFSGPVSPCAPPIAGAQAPVDGIGLVPASPGDVHVTAGPHGRPVVTGADPGVDPAVLRFGYHGLWISLGLGPDPSVAKAIYDSMRYVPGAPDTLAAAGA